jgi:uncharacterized protein YjbI with pentapeptide repeats
MAQRVEGVRAKRAFWKTVDGQRLAVEVFTRLASDVSLSDLKLGEHEGRLDLRGFVLPQPAVVRERSIRLPGSGRRARLETFDRQTRLAGVSLDNLDLSGALLKGLIVSDASIRNCRFDQADCTELTAIGSLFEDCFFRGADLTESMMNSRKLSGIYRRADFAGARLIRSYAGSATFEDCDFGDATLKRAEFGGSQFVRCRFAGLLWDVIFWDHDRVARVDAVVPNAFKDVDFSEADLQFVAFRGVMVDEIRFPSTIWTVREYRCVAVAVLGQIASGESPRERILRGKLNDDLESLGPRNTGVLNPRDFKFDAADLVWCERLLRSAEAECANTTH